MDIIEKMIAGHRDIREREDFLRKLVKMIDADTFFWDDAAKVSHFFNTEVRRHIELEEKVLFPVIKSVLPADQGEIVDAFLKEHGPILAAIDDFDVAARGHLANSSKYSREQVVQRAAVILEIVLPHAANEDEILFKLVRERFDAADYRRLETLYYRHIGV